MVAHTTQFVQPGWRFADSGACKLLADGSGSVVSYVSPTGKDLSIVIETAESNATQTIGLRLGGEFASLKQLHMWKTERAAVFIEQAPLAVAGVLQSLLWSMGTMPGPKEQAQARAAFEFVARWYEDSVRNTGHNFKVAGIQGAST